eukprot:1011153-Prymnesium_polylepis.1
MPRRRGGEARGTPCERFRARFGASRSQCGAAACVFACPDSRREFTPTDERRARGRLHFTPRFLTQKKKKKKVEGGGRRPSCAL